MTAAGWTRGDWMQTYTGRAFYPLDPDPLDVDPLDIAHALSLTCRYNGHVKRFYSVAEHCLLVSRAVPPEHALWGLLHDAAEAYVGDVIRPVKRSIAGYKAVEQRVMLAICLRFGVSDVQPEEVTSADLRILHDERAALLSEPPMPWGVLDGLDPLGADVVGMSPAAAEAAYLARLVELGGAVRCPRCKRVFVDRRALARHRGDVVRCQPYGHGAGCNGPVNTDDGVQCDCGAAEAQAVSR